MSDPNFYSDTTDLNMPPLEEDPTIVVAVLPQAEKANRVARILNGFQGLLEQSAKNTAVNTIKPF